jgi:hypothetical protein
MRRGDLVGVLMLGSTAAVASCTLVLGDDFSIAPESASTSSTTGTGGDGGGANGGGGEGGVADGGAGGGGGIPVPLYDCAWDPASIEHTATLEGQMGPAWGGAIFLTLRPYGFRVFARRYDGNAFLVEVVSNALGNTTQWSFGALGILDVQRFDETRAGVLYTAWGPGFVVEIHYRVFEHNDYNGSESVDQLVTTMATGDALDRARFVFASATDPSDIAVAAAVQGDNGGKIMYGRFSGAPITLTQVTEDDPSLPMAAFQPGELARVGSKNHLFVGDPEGVSRQYSFDDGIAGPMPPTQSFSPNLFPLAIGPAPGGMVDIAVGEIVDASKVAVRAGSVATASLETLDLLSLDQAFVASFTALPLGDHARWEGRHFVAAGTYLTDGTLLGLMLVDEDGHLRANTPLPLPPGQTAYPISSVDARFDGVFADVAFLRIAWTDIRNAGLPSEYQTMRTGLVFCTIPRE